MHINHLELCQTHVNFSKCHLLLLLLLPLSLWSSPALLGWAPSGVDYFLLMHTPC